MGAQDAAEAEDVDFVDTANTECCLSSASLLHVGHAAGREALTMAEKPLLSVRDLKFYFRGYESVARAVDGVSFDVRKARAMRPEMPTVCCMAASYSPLETRAPSTASSGCFGRGRRR